MVSTYEHLDLSFVFCINLYAIMLMVERMNFMKLRALRWEVVNIVKMIGWEICQKVNKVS